MDGFGCRVPEFPSSRRFLMSLVHCITFWDISGSMTSTWPALSPDLPPSKPLTNLLLFLLLYCFLLTVLFSTYCTVLYCTVLYCTILYRIVLYYTVLYYTVLYYTVLYCTILWLLCDCWCEMYACTWWQWRKVFLLLFILCHSGLRTFSWAPIMSWSWQILVWATLWKMRMTYWRRSVAHAPTWHQVSAVFMRETLL